MTPAQKAIAERMQLNAAVLAKKAQECGFPVTTADQLEKVDITNITDSHEPQNFDDNVTEVADIDIANDAFLVAREAEGPPIDLALGDGTYDETTTTQYDPNSRVLTPEEMKFWNPTDGGEAAIAELHRKKHRIQPVTLGQLVEDNPKLRDPVIHGISRVGETTNIIAASKIGKSWLIYELLLCIAMGLDWLGIYPTEQGDVLLIDNELHPETIAHRIPKVATSLGIDLAECNDRIHIASVRGKGISVPTFGQILDQYEPGRLKVVFVDSWYRAMPGGISENDNAAIMGLYNTLDAYALRLGCSFVLIHHSSKGSQSGKEVTDVGSGAGSQSRAADTHLVLRPHEQRGCVVLDAAVRSWAPIEPRVLRWQFPIWTPADDLDPADLKPERPARPKREKAEKPPAEPEWTRERFVAEIVGDKGPTKSLIIANAADQGMSKYKAEDWLDQCLAKKLLYRWTFGRHEAHQFHTKPQPELDTPQLRGEGE